MTNEIKDKYERAINFIKSVRLTGCLNPNKCYYKCFPCKWNDFKRAKNVLIELGELTND